MEVLKPCLYCGSSAKPTDASEWAYLSAIIYCPSCQAKGPQTQSADKEALSNACSS